MNINPKNKRSNDPNELIKTGSSVAVENLNKAAITEINIAVIVKYN
jgi:hypothetical protein